MFERFLYGESLAPLVWRYRGDAEDAEDAGDAGDAGDAMALPPDLCVRVVDDDGG